MANRVYVHIGLPKTATTTLQMDYFPHVNHEEYCFLGVLQPRSEKASDPLFAQVISSARSGEGISEINQALKERLTKQKKSLIISEEMLTVSNNVVSWQQQLAHLATILEGIDYRLLVTIREPVSAMFSLYLELHERFQGNGEDFSKIARTDNQFRIYHYDSLLNELLKYFDIERVYLQKFEALIKADFSSVAEFLGRPSMNLGFGALSNHNHKKKIKNAILLPKRLKLGWITGAYQAIGGEQSKFARMIKYLVFKPLQKLRNIEIGTVPVPTLSDYDRRELTFQMAGTMENMSELFGVRY